MIVLSHCHYHNVNEALVLHCICCMRLSAARLTWYNQPIRKWLTMQRCICFKWIRIRRMDGVHELLNFLYRHSLSHLFFLVVCMVHFSPLLHATSLHPGCTQTYAACSLCNKAHKNLHICTQNVCNLVNLVAKRLQVQVPFGMRSICPVFVTLYALQQLHTRCVPKVSDLPSYLHTKTFEQPLWGMGVTSKSWWTLWHRMLWFINTESFFTNVFFLRSLHFVITKKGWKNWSNEFVLNFAINLRRVVRRQSKWWRQHLGIRIWAIHE